jgi:hypothetical protein
MAKKPDYYTDDDADTDLADVLQLLKQHDIHLSDDTTKQNLVPRLTVALRALGGVMSRNDEANDLDGRMSLTCREMSPERAKAIAEEFARNTGLTRGHDEARDVRLSRTRAEAIADDFCAKTGIGQPRRI